jgi:hypothetical protein
MPATRLRRNTQHPSLLLKKRGDSRVRLDLTATNRVQTFTEAFSWKALIEEGLRTDQ